jgi:peptidyl-prolyl cis-trans isomerase C
MARDQVRPRNRVLQRLLREPLLHFLAIGAVLFAGLSLAGDLIRPTVRLEARELEQLAAYWEMQTQRPPTRQELASIIQERVDEELMAREAIRLGLDKDDMIIRRRLAQKMAFASEDVSTIPPPSEATLKTYYNANRTRWATPARLALRHLYFSQDRTGTSPAIAAAEALKALNAGQPAVGDPALLPLTYADIAVGDLARDYGLAFTAAAREAPLGTWVGPVASPYGAHLIQVQSRLASETLPLADVRSEVLDAWLAEQRQIRNRAFRQSLRKSYNVEIAGLPQ